MRYQSKYRNFAEEMYKKTKWKVKRKRRKKAGGGKQKKKRKKSHQRLRFIL